MWVFQLQCFFLTFFIVLSSPSIAQDEVTESLELIDTQIEEFSADLRETLDSSKARRFYPAAVIERTLHKPTRSHLVVAVQYLFPLFTGGFVALALTENTPPDSLSAHIIISIAAGHFALNTAILKGLDWLQFRSSKNHLEKILDSTWAVYYRQTRNILNDWGRQSLLRSPEQIAELEQRLKVIIKQRFEEFEFSIADLSWYDHGVDNDIVLDRLLQLYLKLWLADAYLTIMHSAQKQPLALDLTTQIDICTHSFLQSLNGRPDTGNGLAAY
jgi:hypothetical protein